MQMSSSVSTRLHYQHKSLLDIIESLSDEQLRRQVIIGKWSIFENIVHLQTYQHLFIKRVKQMLEENDPQFPRYSAEGDPSFLDNCTMSTREILQDLIGTPKDIYAEMAQFKGEDFNKTGQHPSFGKMNLMQWLNFFLLHEAHHLFTIFKLSAEFKKVENQ